MIRHIAFFSLLASAGGAGLCRALMRRGSLQTHCASCHAPTRLGGTGPALIPESLGRLQGEKLETVIAKGRPATQMQGFDQTLSKQEIDALVAYLATLGACIRHLERFRYRGDTHNGCGLQARQLAPSSPPIR